MWENGINLSGGERQRKSIARGLLKKTSVKILVHPIISFWFQNIYEATGKSSFSRNQFIRNLIYAVLDEETAALDTETEKFILIQKLKS